MSVFISCVRCFMYVEATLIGWKPTKCFENGMQKNSKFSVLLCHVDRKTVTDILEERSAPHLLSQEKLRFYCASAEC